MQDRELKIAELEAEIARLKKLLDIEKVTSILNMFLSFMIRRNVLALTRIQK